MDMINYYHRFIPHAAALLTPVNDLLKGTKNLPKPLDWGQDAEHAFLAIKDIYHTPVYGEDLRLPGQFPAQQTGGHSL